MFKYPFIILFALPICCFSLDITSKDVISKRKQDEKKVLERSQKNISFYDLEEDATFQDITEKVYSSDLFCDYLKDRAKSQSRRFYLFSYSK